MSSATPWLWPYRTLISLDLALSAGPNHEQVPHVHFHVIPRSDGDGGKSMLSMWPSAPPMGSVQPDFAALGDLAAKLQAA